MNGHVASLASRLAGFAELSWRLALAVLLFLSLSALTSCAAPLPSTPDAAPIVVPLPAIAADVWASRGHVVHREPYLDPPLEDRDSVLGEAWRAVYTSVSGVDGGLREVSGAFFVPSGTPPQNGWPVISLAHGTTGIGHDCGPSRQPDLMGYGAMINALLGAKYAVAATDYEGLGDSGSHPYLEPRTEAFNTIDAVRAMRDISPTVSASWVGVGFSQGGQAVWAANELNAYYGKDLQLQGSVALAPAANVTGIADLVSSGSLTAEQRSFFPLLVVGVARYSRDLDEGSFLHGSAELYRAQLSRCEPTASPSSPLKSAPSAPNPWREVVNRLRDVNDVKPDTPRDVVTLRDALRRAALPQRPLDKPMLVIAGEQDAIVLPGWVRSAVSDSCALGGRIEYLPIPDAGHDELTWKPARAVERWIADRFAGTTAPSNCPAGQN
jgi:pimeloyl-ACP methyl ester carboxylesterase